MRLKVYQHKYFSHYATSVFVDGKQINITFEGGSVNNPTPVTSKFGTRDPKLQAAIEARYDFGFGKAITLFAEEKLPEPEAPKVVIPEDFTSVPDITTAIGAKNYLLDRFPDLKHSDLKNTTMIKEVAESLKIIFPDL